MPITIAATSSRVQDLHGRVKKFVSEHIIPLESDFYRWSTDSSTKWVIHPQMEHLKVGLTYCPRFAFSLGRFWLLEIWDDTFATFATSSCNCSQQTRNNSICLPPYPAIVCNKHEITRFVSCCFFLFIYYFHT